MDYCYYCMHKKTNNGFCGHCGHKQPEKSEALHHLPIGVVLNNRYLIGRVLGEGGFGITYIGRDLNLDMIVAVKEYFPMGYVSRNSNADITVSVSIGDNKSFFDRGRAKFINEAKTLAKFSGNRSIVDVRDYFECNNTAYIVMEYIQGETLSKYINENGLFTFSALYSSLRPVLIALENIHGTGLIHRDISPDNIMIVNDGSLKLMDFGAARDANFEDQRSLSIVLRPGYAPEEQYRSKGKQGPWTDVYAICATIYKCITGVTPEDSMNRIFSDTLKKPSQLGAVISPAQEQALMAGLRVHQRDRIQTVENLIAAFDGTKKVYAPVPQAYPSYGKQESRTVAADDRTVAANPSAPARFTVQNNNGGNDRSPKKSNKKIVIIIAVIVAVLIAAGATIGIIAAVNGSKTKSENSSSASSKASSRISDSSSKTSSSKQDNSSSKSESSTTASLSEPDGNFVDESLFGNEDNISLTVWVPDSAVEVTKSQIEEFKSHYSGKTFSSITVSAVGEADATTEIINDPSPSADVFGFPSDQIERLVDARVIEGIPDSLSSLQSSVEQLNNPSAVSSAKFNGSLMAYPETCDNGYYLVYDKRVISDSDAQTLEAVLEACKKSGKRFIMDCGNGYYSCLIMFTGGAEIDGFEDDGVTQKFKSYNEDEAVNTLMAFAKLMKTYKGTFISADVTNISSGFSSGTVAAGFDGTWNSTADLSALGENFGAAKLPTINVNGTDKQIVGMLGYKYIGVNSISEFPNAANILAYYLSGTKCQTERAQQIGWGPSNTEAAKSVSSDPVITAINAQSQYSVPQVKVSNTFWTAVGTLGSEIYKDSWNPDDKTVTKSLFEFTIKAIRDE